jgi:hypothetical protein
MICSCRLPRTPCVSCLFIVVVVAPWTGRSHYCGGWFQRPVHLRWINTNCWKPSDHGVWSSQRKIDLLLLHLTWVLSSSMARCKSVADLVCLHPTEHPFFFSSIILCLVPMHFLVILDDDILSFFLSSYLYDSIRLSPSYYALSFRILHTVHLHHTSSTKK